MSVGGGGDRKQQRQGFQGLTRNAKNTKSLKRNDGERKGILIAPLKLPAFLVNSIPSFRGFIPCRESGVGCGPKSCGTDGRSTPAFAPGKGRKWKFNR
jgi:hypothetical protein